MGRFRHVLTISPLGLAPVAPIPIVGPVGVPASIACVPLFGTIAVTFVALPRLLNVVSVPLFGASEIALVVALVIIVMIVVVRADTEAAATIRMTTPPCAEGNDGYSQGQPGRSKDSHGVCTSPYDDGARGAPVRLYKGDGTCEREVTRYRRVVDVVFDGMS